VHSLRHSAERPGSVTSADGPSVNRREILDMSRTLEVTNDHPSD